MIGRLVLVFGLLVLPAPAFAWWDYGHATIARIAWIEASPRTRVQIRRLLAASAHLGTLACPARTIEQASAWADCIKALGDRYTHIVPWHYQTISICRSFDPDAGCSDGHCVTAQIERNARVLADRQLPARERLMALALLIHFVGDLHQPLHVGDRGDLGGNRFPVAYGVIAGPTNLHLAWDGYLAERGLSTPPGGAPGLLSVLSEGDEIAMREGDVTAWTRENWEVAREFAYGSIIEDPCGPVPVDRPVISEATTHRLIPVVRRQASRGGLRLARLLDEALG